MRTVYKVRVTKCNKPYFWYADYVGKEFLVVKCYDCDYFDYSVVSGPVKDDVFVIPYECPLFDMDDCEVIGEVFEHDVDIHRELKTVW